MDATAKALAQALLDSGQRKFVASYTGGGMAQGQVIVVMAVQTTQKGEETVERLSESIKAMPYPYGEPCPCCKGTGRA